MSQSTSSEAYQPHTGDHESDVEYGRSVEDTSVPEPVAMETGISNLSEYNGFSHRGESFMASEVITTLRTGLYHEHSHHGDLPQPQTHITVHAAVDRVLTRLEKRFDVWCRPNPDVSGGETSGHFASTDDLYGALAMDDPLEFGSVEREIAYAKEAHREIINSAIAMLLAEVTEHQEADERVETARAKQELLRTIVSDVSGQLTREEAHEAVDETFDRMEADTE